MKVAAVKCPNCKDVIWSRHRHDCRSCKCQDSFIDGGRDYTRLGGLACQAELMIIDVDEKTNTMK
jgi:hypothetical protein